MTIPRSLIATISIAIAGVSSVASPSTATVNATSARAPMVSCASVSQPDEHAPVGALEHLKVAMPPYSAVLTGVVEKAGVFFNSAAHPLSIEILDGKASVATSTLLAYSGGGLGGMGVSTAAGHLQISDAGLCIARFVGASQPAVVVPIAGPYTQGNFYSIDIFPLSPDQTILSPLSEDLAASGVELLITASGVVVGSNDTSFDCHFSDCADSAAPLLLTVPAFEGEYSNTSGRIADVTSRYPSLLRAEARGLWSAFVHPTNDSGAYPFGILAAWVADETRLHAEAAAIAKMNAAVIARHIRFPNFGIRNLKEFDSELRQFLTTHGYG